MRRSPFSALAIDRIQQFDLEFLWCLFVCPLAAKFKRSVSGSLQMRRSENQSESLRGYATSSNLGSRGNSTATFHACFFLRSRSYASHEHHKRTLRRIMGSNAPHEHGTQLRATSGSLIGADDLPLSFASSARAPRSLRFKWIVNT